MEAGGPRHHLSKNCIKLGHSFGPFIREGQACVAKCCTYADFALLATSWLFFLHWCSRHQAMANVAFQSLVEWHWINWKDFDTETENVYHIQVEFPLEATLLKWASLLAIFGPIQYFGLEFVAAKYAGAAISRGSHFMHHEVDYKDMSVVGGCYWHTEMLSFCRKDILDSMPRVVTLHFMLSTIQLLSQNGKLCACQWSLASAELASLW